MTPRGRYDKARACDGKAPYTEAEAQSAAATISHKKGIMLSAYLCPHCDAWHIGHPPLRVQLRRAVGDKRLRPRRQR